MLPALTGRPLKIEIRASLGRHLAAASIPKRIILLDTEVLQEPGEFDRILIHEIFHFAWRRLPNEKRRSWEALLLSEDRAKGELGWSAEWRKQALVAYDRTGRTLKWRRYACESFCDTAAWLYSDVSSHDEFTLAKSHRARRRAWFKHTFPASRPIPI
jgi:hypothetical protein